MLHNPINSSTSSIDSDRAVGEAHLSVCFMEQTFMGKLEPVPYSNSQPTIPAPAISVSACAVQPCTPGCSQRSLCRSDCLVSSHRRLTAVQITSRGSVVALCWCSSSPDPPPFLLLGKGPQHSSGHSSITAWFLRLLPFLSLCNRPPPLFFCLFTASDFQNLFLPRINLSRPFICPHAASRFFLLAFSF